MKRKISRAPHRIIKKNSAAEKAAYLQKVAAAEAEREDVLAQARELVADIDREKAALAEVLVSLRNERERQGLSLSDIADRTGLARESIHRLEAAIVTNPTLRTLQLYAGALGMRFKLSLSKSK